MKDFFCASNTDRDVLRTLSNIYDGAFLLNVVKFLFFCTKASTRGVLYKKLFLKISQISRENTCVGVSFI